MRFEKFSVPRGNVAIGLLAAVSIRVEGKRKSKKSYNDRMSRCPDEGTEEWRVE